MNPRDIRQARSTRALKGRIQRALQAVEAHAAELEALAEEWQPSDLAELEEMCAGRKPWSYEALLLGLLSCINFHLAEATVTNWRESYARYSPSRFKGDVNDLQLSRGLRNWLNQRTRRESLRAQARA